MFVLFAYASPTDTGTTAYLLDLPVQENWPAGVRAYSTLTVQQHPLPHPSVSGLGGTELHSSVCLECLVQRTTTPLYISLVSRAL